MKTEKYHTGPLKCQIDFMRDEGDTETAAIIGAALIGSSIKDVGFIHGIEGGLAFDYQPKGSKEIRRIIFGYTELGLWVEWEGPLSTKEE